MEKPLISIIIPVYNGSNYLKESIDSALSQEKKNFEVIVINDGSNDGGRTEKIAKSYGNRVRYFKKKNGGVSSALNYGIKKMKGSWFAWLSHDDIYLPTKSKYELEYISKYPKSKIFFSNTGLIDAKGTIIRNPNPIHVNHDIHGGRWSFITWIYACSLLIHKSIFNKVTIFNPNNKTFQDQEMVFTLLNKHHFIQIPKLLVYRRNHNESGVVRLKEYNKKESLSFYINTDKKHGINFFFPDINKKSNNKEISRAYYKMGSYLLKHHYQASEYFYKRSKQYNQLILTPLNLILLLGVKNVSVTINIALNIRNIYKVVLKRISK